MKLIFLNRYFYPDHSATSQMLSDLTFYFSGQGYSVWVITSRLRYDGPNAQLPAFEVCRDVEVHRVWTSRFGRHFLPGRAIDYLTFYLSASWRLLCLAQSGDVIIAKTDPPLISVVTHWVAHFRKARLVNWLQDLFPEVAIALGVKGFSGRIGDWLVKLRNDSLKKAQLNVVLGQCMRERLLEEGVNLRKIKIIHNWADGDTIKPLGAVDHHRTVFSLSQELKTISDYYSSVSAKEVLETSWHGEISSPLRTEWELDGKFVIGYSGNLGRAHEFDTLLRAMEHLNDEEEIQFLFIGGGAQMQALKDTAVDRHLNHLMFKPYQPREQLSESLGVPDLHLVVLRPELEGFIVPSKIYGILAAGKPTVFIGDPLGEIPRILRESDAGVVVETGDVETLVKQILELKGNPDRVRQMGIHARAVFDERFSQRRAFEAWEEVFKSLSER